MRLPADPETTEDRRHVVCSGFARVRYERRSPGKTDRQIKDSIESQLWWSPFVSSDQVNVAVDNGVATLTGMVDTPGERQAATDNAYQGGATLVENNLVVDHEG